MKSKQQKTQLALISIGLFLILTTYLYYPNIGKDKLQDNQFIQKDSEKNLIGAQSTFENVDYEGMTSAMQRFSVKSENARILDKNPDLVLMEKMRVELYLSDGRTVTIISDRGKYNKETHDCWFEENVVADDGETKIFAKNLDLIATKNFVKIYQQVKLIHTTGVLQADQVDYDFESKYFKVSMFDEKTVKMKVFQ
jgi:LPS export ABC transporter protein LptC